MSLPTSFTKQPIFQAQINQCETILNTENINEIFLHCVGNAISRGINLALTLIANSNNGLGYEANTSTLELIGLFIEHFKIVEIIKFSLQMIFIPFMMMKTLHYKSV